MTEKNYWEEFHSDSESETIVEEDTVNSSGPYPFSPEKMLILF